MKETEIHIFTARFPYTKFEVYMESEILEFSKNFNRVYVYPYKVEKEFTREVPNNVIVVENEISGKSKINITDYFIFIYLVCIEIKLGGVFRFFRNRRDIFAYIKRGILYSKFIKSRIPKSATITLYSNWFIDWSFSLSIFKRFHNRKSKLLVKCHRYDLYEDEYYLRFIPFRKWELNICDKVFTISEDGLNYLYKKHPLFKSKFHLFRLGSPFLGSSLEISSNDCIRIVSCSNVKPVKRLELISEALVGYQGSQPLEWHHFGGGDFNEEKKIKAFFNRHPYNVRVFIHGRVPTSELFNFYKTHEIVALINVSASEGIPVSIMEAISFGIPVIGTDVGGTREIVNNCTGLLLPKDISAEKLSSIISNLNSSKFIDNEFRRGVISFWRNNFDSGINSRKFVHFIYSEC